MAVSRSPAKAGHPMKQHAFPTVPCGTSAKKPNEVKIDRLHHPAGVGGCGGDAPGARALRFILPVLRGLRDLRGLSLRLVAEGQSLSVSHGKTFRTVEGNNQKPRSNPTHPRHPTHPGRDARNEQARV